MNRTEIQYYNTWCFREFYNQTLWNKVLFAFTLLFIFQIAAEVSAPLSKTDEIVLIGGNDNTTAEISRLVGQIPPAVNALTGVDLSKVLSKIPGATTKATAVQ